MKRIFWLLPAILLFCAGAPAQEAPQWELGGSYTYAAANISPSYASRFTMSGGGFSIEENLNDWFGGRFEMTALSGTEAGSNVNAQTYTFGPVFSYRKLDLVTPFAHAQLGAIHAGLGYLGISAPATRFDLAAGGGVEVTVSKYVAVRFQGDYGLSHFLNLRQNNLLISAGIVVRLGSARRTNSY